MLIKNFSARRVHDYYDFNFNFHSDVTFLVGINGSGKTSALRLMQAALAMDFSTLTSIKFSSLKIEVENEFGEHTLSILNKKDSLIFSVNGKECEFSMPAVVTEERKIYGANERVDDFVEGQRLQFLKNNSDTLQGIMSGVRPLFLGLERRVGRYDEDPLFIDHITPRGLPRGIVRAKRETLEGLDNCQRLLETAFKQYRRVSDGSIDRMVNVILESSFEYMDFDSSAIHEGNVRPQDELAIMQERRKEIEIFASRLGGTSKISVHIDKFFSQLSQMVSQYDEHNKDGFMSIEWLMNMAQIKRIRRMLEEMDRQKKTAEKYYAPIQDFTSSMNEFLRHSKKEVSVDSVGKIRFSQNGRDIDIRSLSSGEKQLLILLTHARFGSTKLNAFIVDEPEISLHMLWQEMLVDALLEKGGNNQFIFATHSPEIVGFRTRNCIQVG